MNLKTRINLVSVALILTVSAAQIFVSGLSQHESEERFAKSMVNADTVLWNKIVTSELDTMQANTKSLSRDRDTIKALRNHDVEEINDSGESSYNLLSTRDVLTHLRLVDTGGNVVFSAPEGRSGYSAGNLAQQALSQKKVIRGLERDANGVLQSVLAFPLYARGKPAGVAVYGKDLEHAVQDLKQTASAEVALETPDNQLIYSTNDDLFQQLISVTNELDAQKPEHIVHEVSDRTYSTVHMPIAGTSGSILAHLVIAKDETASFTAQRNIDNIAYLTTAIALVLSALGITWYLRLSLQPVSRAVGIMEEIADGDLSKPVKECQRNDETGQLSTALANMQQRLTGIVQEVLAGSDKIAGVAREISTGNTELAQRTEEQSVGLETTVVNMEEITTTVQQNADNAGDANALSADALDKARNGVDSIRRSISAVNDIKQSSSEISEIISLIDEIAFQTNLLALNAAVEAARAGDQGRGFAVVASEVRGLAQRSADAARDITSLIQTSIERVGIGTKMVEDTGVTLEEIMQSVEKVSEIIGGIAETSRHQAAGIQELNSALSSIDGATQRNTAMVEETAVASQLMVEQADALKRLMEFFKLAGGNGASFAAPQVTNLQTFSAGQKQPSLRSNPSPVRQTETPEPKEASQEEATWESF